MAGFEKEWGHRKAGYRKELKFFLDKQTDEYAADKVQIYKKKLEIHIKKEDPDSILKYLKKLDDTEMTIDMIKPTGIGKMVTKLRDLADPGTKVAETCNKLIKNWKEIEKKYEEDSLKQAGLADYSKEKDSKKNELDELVPGSKEADEYFRTTALTQKRKWPDADGSPKNGSEDDDAKRFRGGDDLPLDDTNIDDLIPGTKEFDDYIMKTHAANKVKKSKDEEDMDKLLDDGEGRGASIQKLEDKKNITKKQLNDSVATNSGSDDDNEYPRAQLIQQEPSPVQIPQKKTISIRNSRDLFEDKDEDPVDNVFNSRPPMQNPAKKAAPVLDKHGNWVNKEELNGYISRTFESFALGIISKVKKQYELMSVRFDSNTYFNIFGRHKKQDFPCPKCDKVWDESLDLMGHLVIHFPGPDVVPDTFESCEAKIKANLEDDHRKYCKQMKKRKGPTGKEFRHRDKYARDKEGKFSRAPLQCPKCDALEKDAYEFKKHMLKHWNHYSIKCEECGQRFKGMGVLGSHEVYLAHSAKCKNKDEKISLNVKKPSVKLSIKNTNGGYSSQITKDKAKLSCQGCERRFYTKKALTIHVLKAKPTKKKPYKCALCCENFVQSSLLTKHNEEKHPNGPIQSSMCPHCQCICTGIADVHKHILEIHGEFADLYVDDVDNEDDLQTFEKERSEKDKEDREKQKKKDVEKKRKEKEEDREREKERRYLDEDESNEEGSSPEAKRGRGRPPKKGSINKLSINKLKGASQDESQEDDSEDDEAFKQVMKGIKKRNEKNGEEREVERTVGDVNNNNGKNKHKGNDEETKDPVRRYNENRKEMEQVLKQWR